jgi:hypothetical protein
VAGGQRQRAARGGLGGDHPERLGKGARHHLGLTGRQKAREVVVRERAGEVDPRRGRRRRPQPVVVGLVEERPQVLQLAGRTALELAAARRDLPQRPEVAPVERLHEAPERLAVGAEAHHYEARLGHPPYDERPGGEEQVDTLRDDQLPHVAHDAVATRMELAQGGGRPGLAAPSRGLAGCELVAEPREAGGRLLRGEGAERVDVHAGRAEACPLGERRLVGEHLPQALGGVPRADEHAGRPPNALQRIGQEATGVWANRVLERAAMDLHRIGRPPVQAAGQDHGPHHEVVGERHVGRRDVADGRHVRLEVVVERILAELRVRDGIEALVAVGHVDGQYPADVRYVDRHAVRCLDLAVLAEQVHLVAEPGERPHQAGGVDVASRPAQQVAVEYEDPHSAPLIFPPHASPTEVSASSTLRPRGHSGGRAGGDLRGPRVG